MTKNKTKPRLGKAELEVLKYVQEHAPVSVREVAAGFDQLARTTILTVMERLREKGLLAREKVEGVYRYRPRVDQPRLMRSLVEDFVETTLGGTVSPFLAYLNDKGEVSPEELSELKKLVRSLSGRGKDTKR
jgi:predicted transcriptional regulator